MHKLSIFGVNISNLLKYDILLSDPPPYFDFNNIKNIIQQYDFIVLLDENILFDQQKIIESIEFIIQNNYDLLYYYINVCYFQFFFSSNSSN